MRLVHALRYRRAGLATRSRRDQARCLPRPLRSRARLLRLSRRLPPLRSQRLGLRPAGRVAQAARPPDRVMGAEQGRPRHRQRHLIVQRAVELGVAPEKATVVHLGIERVFLDAGAAPSACATTTRTPTVISDRALEPLYNVDTCYAPSRRYRLTSRTHDLSSRKRRPGRRPGAPGRGSRSQRIRELCRPTRPGRAGRCPCPRPGLCLCAVF